VKNQICEFPCDCPNPNDCSHECEDNCGAPALLRVQGQPYLWMCRKHADYELMCLERGVTNLRREIKKANDREVDRIIEVDFKIDNPKGGHSCDPTDGPDTTCKVCQSIDKEEKRLKREEEAEYTIDRSVPGLHGASHTCTDDWVDDHSEQDCAACMGCGVQSCPTCGWSESPKGKTISPNEKFEAAIRAGKLKIGPQ
jgi:hypothetical protein